MKKNLLKAFAMILTICMMTAYLPAVTAMASAVSQALASNTEKVEVWRRTDIILTAEKTYTNPYKDVEIDAVFTHEDGSEIKLYGFWNGGSEWRVRFAPTKTGVWRYTVTASDTTDAGLNVSGKILAVENTGTTDIDRHGFVEISDSGRYFEHTDGTPFYWLGDTNWQAPNYVSLTQCNYPGCSCGNQFLHELNDRLSKGFTVYQTYFDSAESDGGGQLATTSEPSLWSEKFATVNPDTFTDKIDVMFDTLADCGMVIALGLGVHSHTTNAMNDEDLCRISRYITARYASYPIVWITAQEITGEPQFSHWLASAEVVDAGDGYHHPQGAHQFGNDVNNAYVEALDNTMWHEFYALQSGHGPTFQTKSWYEGYWDNLRNETPKPYIESECNYEDIFCGGFNGYDAQRIAAWKANLCGSYGFTYGVTGVWANNYSTAGNTGWYGSFSYEPWYMGIDKPGSYEMLYLASFFRYVVFSTLLPRFNNTAYSNLTAESKVLASSADSKTYVAYFYNSSVTSGELYGLNDGETYSAKWFNPLTGKFVEITDSCEVVDGVYKIPNKPTAGDWALLVTSCDLGEYSVETAYTDDKMETRTNYALDAKVSVSSNNGVNNAAGAANDGNLSTYWCAANGDMPQWLELDFGNVTSFAEIDLVTFRGAEYITRTVSFVIEGSLDGESYETFYTADKAEPLTIDGMHYIRIKKSGNYRYLKVTFSEFYTGDIENNWATTAEIGVYDTPAEEDLVEEESANILENAAASASSFTSVDGAASLANDGNDATYWCGMGDTNQWIAFEMKKAKSFNTISFTMDNGSVMLDVVIEVSDDGVTYTPVYTNTALTPIGTNGTNRDGAPNELYEIDLAATAGGKFIRVYFNKVTGDWATMYAVTAGMKEDTTEQVYDVNLLTGVTASANGSASADGGPDKAVDGNASTWWCGTGYSGWIAFDMGKVNRFDKLFFTMYGGTSKINVVIETSTDGTTYSPIISDSAMVPTGKDGNSELFAFTFDEVEEARYIRITFNEVENNWATIVEATALLRAPSIDDPIPSYDGTLQTPAVSGTGGYIYDAAGNATETLVNLFDNDTETLWTPFHNLSSQTLVMDLGEVKTLYGMTVILGPDATVPEYRIEGSLDGESWFILADATLRAPVGLTSASRVVMSEALSGSYRYVKLLWLGDDSAKSISEIALYAEGATKSVAKASTDLLLSTYNALKSLSNSDKDYTATSYRAFREALFTAAVTLMPKTAPTADEVAAVNTALLAAKDALVELLGEQGTVTPYISYRQNGTSHDIRFVIAADLSVLAGKESVDVTVTFTGTKGKKTTTLTLSNDEDSDFVLCSTVKGAGKSYTGRANIGLFGLVVTGIPTNDWTSVTVSVTSGGTTLSEGSITYAELIQ